MWCEKDLGGLKALLVVGMPGSGKGVFSEVAEKECGLSVFVMGDVVREEIIRRGLELSPETSRRFAIELRRELGPEAIAILTHRKICSASSLSDYVVIDGVRSLDEVNYFKRIFGEVVVIAIHASPVTRFQRLYARGRSDDPRVWSEFVDRDLMELSLGIGSVIALADHMIVNEDKDLRDLRRIARELLEKILNKRCRE